MVDGLLRPVVRIAISGQTRSFPAWIDLGFEGELVMPRAEARRLGVAVTNQQLNVILGDGSTTLMPLGRLKIRWLGRARQIRVLISSDPEPSLDEATGEAVALVGLGLLRGSRLTIDLTPGGGILIERPIPTASA